MATAPAGPWAPTAAPPRRHGAGHIVLIVLGSLALLISLGLLAGGSALLYADRTMRDGDGYLHTSTTRVTSSTYAIASRTFEVATGRSDFVLTEDRLGSMRVTATGAGGAPVFVGVGPQADVDAYLSGVEYDSVSGVRSDPFRLTYDRRSGSTVPAAPGTKTFWAASATGSGTQTLTWKVQSGNWAVVLMNADASPGVAADVRLAATVPFLLGLSIGLLVAGGVLLGIAVLMIVLGARGSRPVTPPPGWAMVPAGWAPAPTGAAPPAWGPPAGMPPGVPPPPPSPPVGVGAGAGRPTVYPVALEARLDEPLSRWLWLVKWLLAIPHFIVLAFLWVAFCVLTVVAFFAILFTERYPRWIFDVNVGIMRWTWRVAYYTFGGLGTDRYPPFSFEPTDYPATLEVAYPERLSRGLVLVKWWLLAIPHYLVVGVLAGGGFAFAERAQAWAWTPAGGLIGAVAVAAGIMLLVSGRYPRGLHDLVVGLNRWVVRVAAYATLMRDEYPPFRLDLGPAEPGPEAPRPSDLPVGMLPRPG